MLSWPPPLLDGPDDGGEGIVGGHHRGGFPDPVLDLVGVIGRHVLAELLPRRRIRTKGRIVKRAISKYNTRGPVINRATYKAAVSINMLTTDP
ncbi:hypothetical protein ACIRVF_05150 [Kitasatospora sp. NPDC101157]|uniref:hypothetical protein n=1 Tax=Kitasatospora sp. NPDC101157 TaxID=3364098 RepID=UPI0037FF9F14